jgi:hypothetical protein
MLSCNAAGIPATVELFDQIDLHRRTRIPVAWAYSFDIPTVLFCPILYLCLPFRFFIRFLTGITSILFLPVLR